MKNENIMEKMILLFEAYEQTGRIITNGEIKKDFRNLRFIVITELEEIVEIKNNLTFKITRFEEHEDMIFDNLTLYDLEEFFDDFNY